MRHVRWSRRRRRTPKPPRISRRAISSSAMSASASAAVPALGGEPHDQAPRSRAARNAIVGLVLRIDAVGDHLRQTRDSDCPPRLQRPAHDHGRLARAGEKVGQHPLVDHQLHLVRKRRAPRRRPCRRTSARTPGCRADRFGIASRADRYVGLAQGLFCGMSRIPRSETAARCARRAPRGARAPPPITRGPIRLHAVTSSLGGPEPTRTRRPRRPSRASPTTRRSCGPRLSADLAVLHRVDGRPRRAARRSSSSSCPTIWPSSSSVPIAEGRRKRMGSPQSAATR